MSEAIESRLSPIMQLGEQIDIEYLRASESEAKYLHETYGILPTIGCEVEVKWSTHFPELARKYFGEQDEFGRFEHRFKDLPTERQQELDKLCLELNEALLPRYEATAKAGIPKGRDAYWEFANAPTYSSHTLAAEIDMLFKSGLIPEGFQHSLHVTLGGASDKGGGMCLILSGLELLYATPERIVSATEDNQFGARSTWARRGEDGIRRRPASMLDLCQTVATELRTLSVSSSEQARSIFFDAQMLTTTLLAFRSRQETSEPLILEIADIWPVYRSIIKRIWEVRGLPAESWGSPHRHADIWVKWADSLSLRDQDGSMEYTTACQVREISTRTADLLVKLGLS